MEKTEKVLNPGPLGLVGFGLATILLNIHNLGLIDLSIVIVALGVAMGGLVQLIAGLYEFKNKNTFAGTAFIAFGGFWFSLVLIWLLKSNNVMPADNISMGFYLLIWGLFGLIMFIGTLKHNMISRLIFGCLTLLFFLLAIADFTMINALNIVAGVVGIITGLLALYNAAGQIIHEEFGKTFLPLF